MASSSSTLSLLLLLAAAVTAVSAVSATACGIDLIRQTCKNSSSGDQNVHYPFCVYALQSAPASRCATLNRLGLITINLVRSNATDTRCLIAQFFQPKTFSGWRRARSALKDCQELYSDAVPTLREAARDYRAKRFDDANVKVGSVLDAAGTCEDGFGEVGVKSPLTKQNNHSFQLSAIALSIMNMVSSSTTP